VVVCLGVSLQVVGCSSEPSYTRAIPTQTAAVKLATIEGQGSASAEATRQWQLRLERVARKCRQPMDRAAEMLFVGHRELTQRGGHRSLSDFARIIDAGLPINGVPASECAALMSATVVRDVSGAAPDELDATANR
jgi:hypothetical protein